MEYCRKWTRSVNNEIENFRLFYTYKQGHNPFFSFTCFFSFKLPYRLHAVLVHEGQASGGHYWAYIQDPSQQRWCKFNDITVSEVTWEEVSRESLGSYRNVSAYCLMYIDARREGCIGAGGSIHELPLDLKELVDKDNAEFENEMRDWDEKQLAKTGKSGDSICPFWLYLKKKRPVQKVQPKQKFRKEEEKNKKIIMIL